ncbi:MAG: hypothetical protein ABIO57_03685 [Candidatus Paceibacterota bacterium]
MKTTFNFSFLKKAVVAIAKLAVFVLAGVLIYRMGWGLEHDSSNFALFAKITLVAVYALGGLGSYFVVNKKDKPYDASDDLFDDFMDTMGDMWVGIGPGLGFSLIMAIVYYAFFGPIAFTFAYASLIVVIGMAAVIAGSLTGIVLLKPHTKDAAPFIDPYPEPTSLTEVIKSRRALFDWMRERI